MGNVNRRIKLRLSKPNKSRRGIFFFITPIIISITTIAILRICNNTNDDLEQGAKAFGFSFSIMLPIAYAFMRRPNITNKNEYLYFDSNYISIKKNDSITHFLISELSDIHITLTSYDHGPPLSQFEMSYSNMRGGDNNISFKKDGKEYSYQFYIKNQYLSIRLVNVLRNWKDNGVDYKKTVLKKFKL
jgi:hypothetical protein